MPTFSVVLPTYNRPDMLQRAVASVLQQTYTDFELIVVDDGSATDYCSALTARSDPRLRVMRSRWNRGVAAARSIGVAAAEGPYISFLDDDDEYVESFLASTHAVLADSDRDVAMSWCGVSYVHYPSRDALLSECATETREFPIAYLDRRSLYETLLSIGIGHGVTIKTALFKQVGGFSDFATVEDTDIFLRLISSGLRPVVVPGAQIVIHNHGLPRLTGAQWHSVRIRECGALLVKYRAFFARYPSLRAQLTAHMADLDRRARLDSPTGGGDGTT